MSLGSSLRCAASSRSRCSVYSSSGSLRCGLALMAWPAQRFKIAVVVCAAVSFRDNVVDRFRWAWSAVAQALLADVSITLKDADADDIPLTAVATLVAAQTALMLLPSFITVGFAVARTIRSCARATSLTACSGNSCGHGCRSNKKATSRCQWLRCDVVAGTDLRLALSTHLMVGSPSKRIPLCSHQSGYSPQFGIITGTQ